MGKAAYRGRNGCGLSEMLDVTGQEWYDVTTDAGTFLKKGDVDSPGRRKGAAGYDAL
ncbi:MAG: hypothetical protein K6F35_08200 [Lachnospiraceae bacterium]|nr:hypothetical protein [Lachnospiraceae bacterium]